MLKISIISAMDENKLIGSKNSLPWSIPEELAYFKENTLNKVLIMGRKTFDSIGRRALPKRKIIVLSSVVYPQTDVIFASSKEEALLKARQFITENNYSNEIMIAGGAKVYSSFLEEADTLYLSIIHGKYKGDTYFPDFNMSNWICTHEDSYDKFTAKIFSKKETSIE